MPLQPTHLPNPAWIAVKLLTGFAGAASAQTTEWVYHKTADGLHPDGNEQQMVWLMNRARANPAAEGIFLAASGDAGINDGISYFRVDTNLMKAEFAAILPQPPAAFDRRIYEGSRVHSVDLIARDAQDHNNQSARVTSAGFSFSSGARFNVFSYADSAVTGHGALNIDWGPGGTGGMQSGRGHRIAMMSNQATLLTNVGLALVPDNNPNTNAGPLVFSGAYCGASATAADHYNRFLVGTVWTDGNGNNRYDPGEGLNGVRVQPDRGVFHAVTGAGGGWSIPITSPDTYNLTFFGGTIQTPIARSATVAATSVLVDLPYTVPPPSMTLTIQPQGTGNLLLTWTGGKSPWQIQETTSLALPWTNRGAAVTTTSLSIPLAGPRRYYRVVGAP